MRCGRAAARLCGAAAGLLLLVEASTAQTPQPLTPPTQPQAAPAGPPAASPPPPAASRGDRPGFVDAFGHWIEGSVSDWNSGLKDAADVAKDAADAAGTVTRDTAGAVARIPGTRVISEHATCPTAPNGAPDCRTAAESICKGHGFASGSSIDFQTVEKCPPVAVNGQDGQPAPCVIESYVTRALCQ